MGWGWCLKFPNKTVKSQAEKNCEFWTPYRMGWDWRLKNLDDSIKYHALALVSNSLRSTLFSLPYFSFRTSSNLRNDANLFSLSFNITILPYILLRYSRLFSLRFYFCLKSFSKNLVPLNQYALFCYAPYANVECTAFASVGKENEVGFAVGIGCNLGCPM